MVIIRKTLEENYIFFLKELVRINEEIKGLPQGSISAKRIGGRTYYYHQWRDGKKVKSVLLGTEPDSELLNKIRRKKQLIAQREEILNNIAVIKKTIDIQRVTVEEIVKLFCMHGIEFLLIGSYYLPVLKEIQGFVLPTIRTQDVDFLLKIPYRGKGIDIESLLKPLGFSTGFNPDGSTYFTNGVFKVEFLVPEKARGGHDAVSIRPLRIRATALRYLQMLFDYTINVEREGYSFKIPAPWVFAFHKILISKRRREKDKGNKDELQANAILREVFLREETRDMARKYLETLPIRWQRAIRTYIAEHFSQGFD